MLSLPIYLDHNATTPCDPRVVEAMLPYFNQHFGNAASRNHPFGWHAAEAVEFAREKVAGLIGAETKEIIFTSGATEAANLAIKGVFESYATKGKHIITCAVEHNAVLDTCRHLEKAGAEITYLGVTNKGMVDMDKLKGSFRDDTILVAIMYANNETGNLMQVKQISEIAKKQGVLVFSDATQAVGKIPVDVNRDGIDLMAFSAHKLYGPKGTGALYVRRRDPRVRLTAQIDGGGHERGMRSGTLNVPGIVGLGKACELASQEMDGNAARMQQLRDRLETALLKIEEVSVNGEREQRLTHVSNISFKYVDGENLLSGINKEIAVSSGAACTSASMEPSHVLKAMGLPDDLAYSSIRFSLGKNNTEEEIDYTIEKVTAVIKKLRELSPVFKSN